MNRNDWWLRYVGNDTKFCEASHMSVPKSLRRNSRMDEFNNFWKQELMHKKLTNGSIAQSFAKFEAMYGYRCDSVTINGVVYENPNPTLEEKVSKSLHEIEKSAGYFKKEETKYKGITVFDMK